MKKNSYEKIRIRCTWLFGIAITALMLVSGSYWEPTPIIEESLMFFACFLAGIGAFGRAWCFAYISGRKDTDLVQLGPYALCRNPLYFFSILGAIGVGLATETITVPLLILLAFCVYYPSVILSEEKRLTQLFGDEYIKYRAAVPSLFPKFSLMKNFEPESYVINPIKFRRSLLDALWFVWIIGIIELIEGFREAGFLLILIKLY